MENFSSLSIKNGAIENSIENIKNLIVHTGWSIDKAIEMNGLSEEIKSKVYEAILKEKYEFFSEPHIFADIINAILFEGEQVLKKKHIMSNEFFNEESESLKKNRDLLKRIQYIDEDKRLNIFYLGLKLLDEINLDIQIKIREDDAKTYFDLLDKYDMRYYVKTIILLFASHNDKQAFEYDLSKEMQEYLYYSDTIILNMATIDAQLFHSEEMQVLVRWYQLYNDNKNSALEYINSLETYPNKLISVIATLIDYT